MIRIGRYRIAVDLGAGNQVPCRAQMPGEIAATGNGVEANDSCDYLSGNRRDGSWAGARGQVAEAEIGSHL